MMIIIPGVAGRVALLRAAGQREIITTTLGLHSSETNATAHAWTLVRISIRVSLTCSCLRHYTHHATCDNNTYSIPHTVPCTSHHRV